MFRLLTSVLASFSPFSLSLPSPFMSVANIEASRNARRGVVLLYIPTSKSHGILVNSTVLTAHLLARLHRRFRSASPGHGHHWRHLLDPKRLVHPHPPAHDHHQHHHHALTSISPPFTNAPVYLFCPILFCCVLLRFSFFLCSCRKSE